ncbi:MAG: UpxY family transcription antiterminator [Nitrospira sp.]|nr:UpxY family transcription antiterminator [Nitrospira sp.]
MHQTDTLPLQWYAIHVRSRHEFQIFDRLKLKGIEAFLPTVEKLRKWKDRKKLVTFPLFPGYLFVRITKDARNMLEVLKIKGVVNMICSLPGEPAPIPDEQVTALKTLVENGEELDPYPYLTEGQNVRIVKGPMAGIEGILVEKLDKHCLVLSVDVLQQGVALTINAADVEKT